MPPPLCIRLLGLCRVFGVDWPGWVSPPMAVWMGWTGHPAGGCTRADAHYNQPSFFFLFSIISLFGFIIKRENTIIHYYIYTIIYYYIYTIIYYYIHYYIYTIIYTLLYIHYYLLLYIHYYIYTIIYTLLSTIIYTIMFCHTFI